MDEYKDLLNKRIDTYNINSQYKLSMSIGKSRLKNEYGVRGSISDWKMDADMEMYRVKEEFHKANKIKKRGQ